MGQVYYQMNNYVAAIDRLEVGIRVAKDRDFKIKENWWALLNYLYFELENWDKVVEILGVLQEAYPSDDYAKRLNAVRGMLENQ